MEKKYKIMERSLMDNKEILEKLIDAQRILGECYSSIIINDEAFSDCNSEVLGRITEISGYVAKLGYEISHGYRKLYKLVDDETYSNLFRSFIELGHEIRTFIDLRDSLPDIKANQKIKEDINHLIDSLKEGFYQSINDNAIIKAINVILNPAIKGMDFAFFPNSEYYTNITNTLKGNGFRVESAHILNCDSEGYVVYLKENHYV